MTRISGDMKRKAFIRGGCLLAALCLLLALLPAAASAEDAAPVSVACLGDSLTFGLSAGDSQARVIPYPARLAGLLGEGYQVFNLGVCGAALSGGSQRYRDLDACAKGLELAADVYYILLGTNDSVLGETWDEALFEEELDRLLSACRGANEEARIILITPPVLFPAAGGVGSFSVRLDGAIVPILRQKAEDEGLTLVDFYAETLEKPELVGADGVHLSQAGYDALAVLAFESLESAEEPDTLKGGAA